jgi:acyl-CoA synthetase (AMP-forming)/AMP-acid ligase II
VVFVEALPTGATGKIQKNKLREQFREWVSTGDGLTRTSA